MATGDDVRKNTVMKLYDLKEGDKMSRKTFEDLGKGKKAVLEKLNPKEASNAHAAFMSLADGLNFTTYAEDGGKEVTVEEYIDILNKIPVEKLATLGDAITSPFFRAIDLDGNGFISRDEWRNFLKAFDTFESEEQARASFDSLDTNHDDKISLEEYLDANRRFWGESNEAKDFFGTEKS